MDYCRRGTSTIDSPNGDKRRLHDEAPTTAENGGFKVRMHLQPLPVLKKMAIAAVMLLTCAGAHAQTTIYTFGSQLGNPSSTTYQPADTFAALSVTSTDGMHYIFDLQATSSLGALFGSPDAGIRLVLFNTSNVDPVAGSVHLLSGTQGVSNIFHSPGDTLVGGVTFDFTDGWYGANSANGRLNSGERAIWEASFSAPTNFVVPPFALKVFGINGSDSNFAWYVPTVSAVPEPETYGMLLAGLGMLGFAARRRKMRDAAAA